MSASIYDVAELAGVAISTVSRVINKSGYVSAKTEQKVTDAMQKLGYYPSIAAQNLARNSTGLVGLYFPHVTRTDVYWMEFIRGAGEVVMDQGYHLLLINELNESKRLLSGESVPQYTNFLRQRRIDGLLFGSAPLRSSSFFELIQDQAPVVYVGERLVSDRGLNVYAKYRENVWMLLDYLFERRHRRIRIFLFGEPEVSEIVREFQEEKDTRDLQIQVRVSSGSLENYLEMLAHEFEGTDYPTGLLIMDFSKVQPTINFLNNIGKQVPEDVSVLTQEHHFGDGDQCFPAVTSIYVPVSQMGVESTRLLFDYLNGRVDYNKQVLLSPQIIERNSVSFQT